MSPIIHNYYNQLLVEFNPFHLYIYSKIPLDLAIELL